MEIVVTGYNKLSKSLHWLSAILVFGMFAAGYWMVDLTYYSEWYKTAPHWHKSVGICLIALTILRLFWKTISSSPPIYHHRAYVITQQGGRLHL